MTKTPEQVAKDLLDLLDSAIASELETVSDPSSRNRVERVVRNRKTSPSETRLGTIMYVYGVPNGDTTSLYLGGHKKNGVNLNIEFSSGVESSIKVWNLGSNKYIVSVYMLRHPSGSPFETDLYSVSSEPSHNWEFLNAPPPGTPYEDGPVQAYDRGYGLVALEWTDLRTIDGERSCLISSTITKTAVYRGDILPNQVGGGALAGAPEYCVDYGATKSYSYSQYAFPIEGGTVQSTFTGVESLTESSVVRSGSSSNWTILGINQQSDICWTRYTTRTYDTESDTNIISDQLAILRLGSSTPVLLGDYNTINITTEILNASRVKNSLFYTQPISIPNDKSFVEVEEYRLRGNTLTDPKAFKAAIYKNPENSTILSNFSYHP